MLSQTKTPVKINDAEKNYVSKPEEKDKSLIIEPSRVEQMARMNVHYSITFITDYFPQSVKLDVSKLQCFEKLQSGISGVVFRGAYNHKVVAIKKYHSQVKRSEFDDETNMLAEVKRLKIPNVVDYVGYIIDESPVSKYTLIMEYLPRGDLFDFIMSSYAHHQPLSAKTRYKIIEIVARSVAALHRNNIVHADLKPENIFVGAEGEIKIGDFGLSCKINARGFHVNMKPQGTVVYTAPEIFTHHVFSPPSDVYALGSIIYSLETNRTPFAKMGLSTSDIAKAVCRGQRAEIPVTANPKMAHLIKWCWAQAPLQRPSALQVAEAARTLVEEIDLPAKNYA